MLRVIDGTKFEKFIDTIQGDENDSISCHLCPCCDADCRDKKCSELLMNHFSINLEELSTDELGSALSTLSTMYERTVEALDHRKQEEKKKDWDELTGTLSHYIQKYGNIWIDVDSSQDRISLGADFDDSIMGHLAF